MLKILFYAPHSAIWVRVFPEALIAEALQQQIHRIVYVTCGRQFKDYCAAMSGFGLSYDSPSAKKKKICDKCQTHGNIIKRNFNLTGYDLADKIEHNDIQSVYRVLQDVTKENFLDFEIDNVAVGRLALYQFCYVIRIVVYNSLYSVNRICCEIAKNRGILSYFFACRWKFCPTDCKLSCLVGSTPSDSHFARGGEVVSRY